MKKNIVRIGGSYGIGAAIAKRLKENHELIIASRSKENIQKDINGRLSTLNLT